MILFTQPIFCPNDKYFDFNLKSIESFIAYLEKYPCDYITPVFGGYAKKDEYWNKIVNTIRRKFPSATIIKYNRNYGKAFVINNLVEVASKTKDYKYLFTIDSDMCFDLNESNMFDRLVSLSDILINRVDKKLGLLALNQRDRNCHVVDALKESEIVNNEKLMWNNYPGYIGGGCLFINMNAWKEIGGYRILGVYAGDDAYILIDMKSHGFSYQVVDTIGMIHPPDHDEPYIIWKSKMCQRDTAGGVRKDLEPIVKEFEEYWNKKEGS